MKKLRLMHMVLCYRFFRPLTIAGLVLIAGLVTACASSLPSAGGLNLFGNSNTSPPASEATTVAYMPDTIPPVPEKRDPKRKLVVAANFPAEKTTETDANTAPANATKPDNSGFAGLFTQAAAPGGLFSKSIEGPSSVSSSQSPVSAYATLARLIKNCWLSFSNPRLKNHKFDGEASLEQGEQARIVIYEKVEGQKLGKYAFKIDLKPEGNGALIESENYRLTPEESGQLRNDIARWAKGEQSCSS